jgi:hypothetical protein
MSSPVPQRPASGGAERWHVDGGDAAQAMLRIPADLARERVFEIACAMTVQSPAGSPAAESGAWHQMTVHVDGQQQWSRRVPTHNPGSFDGLDLRLRRSVPPGKELRISAAVACGGGARRRSLRIEADEA